MARIEKLIYRKHDAEGLDYIAGQLEVQLSAFEHAGDYEVCFYRANGKLREVIQLDDAGVQRRVKDGVARLLATAQPQPRQTGDKRDAGFALVNVDTGEVEAFCDTLWEQGHVEAVNGPAAGVTSTAMHSMALPRLRKEAAALRENLPVEHNPAAPLAIWQAA
ncbi:hypothetical protein IV417_17895 [Alphaproteobacteria bacterium KMM 3653]|uniref:Uncharacterized protein n=1 Tax=Harenicola maris TaxID=2841044 RepID=A0AAP2CSM1_9RHOB|nr:hypothetical protein [Harenicola maris]